MGFDRRRWLITDKGDPDTVQLVDHGALTENEVRSRFEALAEQWRDECAYTSSLEDMFAHRAYREIISLGLMVVPLLLRDIESTHDYWGRALREITGANPVPKSIAGDMEQVAKAWVKWGKKKLHVSWIRRPRRWSGSSPCSRP